MLKLLNVILLAMLAACASLPSATVILVNEAKLKDKIEVNNVTSNRTATGVLRVWGEIKNRTDKDLMIEVRASFRGDKGRPVEKAGGWSRVFVRPNSLADFELLSTVENAEEFILEVQEGNVIKPKE